MKERLMKKTCLAVALLASSLAHAESKVVPPNAPTVSAGRTFQCLLLRDVPHYANDAIVSCRLVQPVIADDRKSVAIEAGAWLNGRYDGEGAVLWQAVQTGDHVGALIYSHPDAMLSVVRGVKRHGDELQVRVLRDIAFPTPDSKDN